MKRALLLALMLLAACREEKQDISPVELTEAGQLFLITAVARIMRGASAKRAASSDA